MTLCARNIGLIHISQISEYRVEKVDDVLAVGEAVFVKVLPSEVNAQ